MTVTPAAPSAREVAPPPRLPDDARMRRATSVLLALAAFLCTFAPAPPSARAEIVDRIDESAPELECAKWFGDAPAKWEKFRGRVVVLHFSRPEVVTSRAAAGSLRDFAKKWATKPVTVIEVALSVEEASVAAYVSRDAPPWPVGHDAAGATAAKFPGTSVPRTYLIGPDGRIFWHAHILALTDAMVQEQLDRIAFVAPGPEVKLGKGCARAAGDMRWADALAAAAKLETDAKASDADREIARQVRAEVPRAFQVDLGRAEKLVTERDYGLAWRRFERMLVRFKGTVHEKAVQDRMAELDAKEIVPFCRKGQDRLDDLMTKWPTRTRSDVEKLIVAIDEWDSLYGETRPAERAAKFREEMTALLATKPKR
ncbi:MAG: hypothetical protein HMLKMBBP_00988 [Planctomycetes bacterium]|nr:hypothetical protein [Planctomycetota bacterium]